MATTRKMVRQFMEEMSRFPPDAYVAGSCYQGEVIIYASKDGYESIGSVDCEESEPDAPNPNTEPTF
jgi:hypothetical protein